MEETDKVFAAGAACGRFIMSHSFKYVPPAYEQFLAIFQ